MGEIDGVLAHLDGIIAACRQEGSRMGYFAALYRQMTARVKAGIDEGRFEDAARMDRLDAIFAQRYFDAYETYRAGGRPTQAWQVAFVGAQRSDLTIVQQLLLGINAHINLDLGIAAAEVAPGAELVGLKRDFDTINDVIASLMNEVFAEIDELSPVLAVLDRFGGRFEKRIMNLSIDLARYEAWHLAQSLALRHPDDQEAIIAHRDGVVAGLGREIEHPGPILSAALRDIAAREVRDPATIIDVLDAQLRSL